MAFGYGRLVQLDDRVSEPLIDLFRYIVCRREVRTTVLRTGRMGEFRLQVSDEISEVDKAAIENRSVRRAEKFAEEIGGVPERSSRCWTSTRSSPRLFSKYRGQGVLVAIAADKSLNEHRTVTLEEVERDVKGGTMARRGDE